MQPVSTFTSRTGSTIEIYAVGEHGYFATEMSDSATTALDQDAVARMTPAELYVSLTGLATAPAALVALSAHVTPIDPAHLAAARDRRATRPTGTSVHPSPTIDGTGNCTAANFTAAGFCPGGIGHGDSADWCLLNWGGGAWEYQNTVDLSQAFLCSTHGDILWQIQNGDGGFHQWTVLTNQWFNYFLHDSDETWLHYDVLHASGDEFQFGGYMDWY
jgi:hypothetical protein